ncbi:MAG: UDP-N-acetylmuramoyl-L-alanine--D-glutamate ligase [Bacteroidales bacterium]|nr:UDP-N-acetylmuramoyl-L-alanine--D-glutamate ligase [Bacteroidales bacterium]MBN2756848.1 UDP-N-acetylmuramoyl-L-alanine--D-glutamate ligase [Bacteroidales bacterium]
MKKKLVILGAAESGTGAAILAQKKGFDVFVSDFGAIKDKYKKLLDKNKIKWEENKHSQEIILNADEIIKSPGISDKVEIIKKIKEKNISLISEIEFAARYTNAKKICITGSNGKTTTTMLIYHTLKKAGLNVGLGGNVGNSFALQVANFNYDYYVLELSSFQLDYMFEFKADIAILLNITPDHMDWYNNDFSKYVDSKFKIIQKQDSSCYFLYNTDDQAIIDRLLKIKFHQQNIPFSIYTKPQQGGFIENDKLSVNFNNNSFEMNIHDLALQGKHNLYNSLAASISAKILDIKNPDIRESLADFKGVEHRLEKFIKVRSILFINDSKSTNVNSSWYALESMETPTVLILGGIDKGNDYSILKELVNEKVKAIIALGKDNSRIHDAFSKIVPIIDSNSMSDAVNKAYHIASEGDTVLLSPACASFDLFENYEDRGRKFKEAVRKL